MKNQGGFMIFWDYDTQWGADRSRSVGGPKNWGRLDFENTERLLELHAQFKIPGCFAVVGAAALPGSRPYHDPAQIRRIHAAGHEIASHSFQHDWLPALGPAALRETLMRSKESLQQCIGAEVLSFVPPWNQPFDYLAGLSVSLSERRQVRKNRTDLKRLCDTLAECGYRFSRVAYRPLHRRLLDRVCGRRVEMPLRPEAIGRILTLRVNTPCGFATETQRMVISCGSQGGFAVAYGHPHSLTSDGPQGESHLVALFKVIDQVRSEGKLQVLLPRDLVDSSRSALP
jgi:peptidoglycan/xylan/chitin deacetylase (PgdA/CDA1 family)